MKELSRHQDGLSVFVCASVCLFVCVCDSSLSHARKQKQKHRHEKSHRKRKEERKAKESITVGVTHASYPLFSRLLWVGG